MIKIQIRSIKIDELDEFIKINSSNKDTEHLSQLFNNWFEEGKTKPEWCFVAIDKDKFIGRVVYWALDDSSSDLRLMLIHFPENKFLEVGIKLLKESLNYFVKSSKTIYYHLHDNVQDFELYKQIFLECQFDIIQQKISFQYNKTSLEQPYHQLVFKSLDDVSEEVFISAIKEVTKHTLDSEDQLQIKEIGEDKAAISYFTILKEIDYNPKWWKLAYTDVDQLVGLVVPQKFNDNLGAINYIGVIPNFRGYGYGYDLLIEGTKILKDNNIKTIIADVDNNNYPLEKALNKVGYEVDCTMIVYRKIMD